MPNRPLIGSIDFIWYDIDLYKIKLVVFFFRKIAKIQKKSASAFVLLRPASVKLGLASRQAQKTVSTVAQHVPRRNRNTRDVRVIIPASLFPVTLIS
jgi:hypothetical protein